VTRADLPEALRDRLAFSPAEVGRLSGLSSTCIKTEIKLGRLAARRVGGGEERATWIITLDSMVKWLSEPQAAGE
jgi:hypothetical protein